MDSSIILNTSYLPPIEYFCSISKANYITIEINENYIKQTFRNRCYIYAAGGKQILSIPVIKTDGNHTIVKNILISYHTNWQRTHWRAIESAYSSSPFFIYYKDDLKYFYETTFERLIDFNNELLHKLLNLLDIKIKLSYTDKFMHRIDNFGNNTSQVFTKYQQVFGNKHGFIPNLSIIDLLFNLGPDAKEYLNNSEL